jgi:1-acyl-sn-glycerol-3-phosphate acyltransferase
MQPLSVLLSIALAGAIVAFVARLYRLLRAANFTEWGGSWLNLLDGLNRLFCRYYHRLQPFDLPIPSEGPAVVIANHVSGLDPLLLIAASRRPLRFLIAREQYERLGLNRLFRAVGCIPVDRQGRPERALREALKSLRQGEVVALFPYGRIHLPSERGLKLKPGALFLARRSAAPLIPVRIEGVSGIGRVISAVFIRSRASLSAGVPFHPAGLPKGDIAARLGVMLGDKTA